MMVGDGLAVGLEQGAFIKLEAVWIAVGYSSRSGKLILGVKLERAEAEALTAKWVEQCEWVDVEMWKIGEELVKEGESWI